MLIPRSVAIIRKTLAEIEKMPIKTVGQWPADMPASIKDAVASAESQDAREQAVRMLMGYRYLCDLPWRDIMLDRTYIAHTEAASQLLLKVGTLTHTPKNPGLPEAEYQFGYRGTIRSNLQYSSNGTISDIPHTVKGYMDDSDPSNIEMVGHRRWCLNPKMLKTGFGSSGLYSAMYSLDNSRENVPDYDHIAFPTPGMTPVEWFKKHYAWNISLNPSKYSAPEQGKVKARIFPARYSSNTGKVDKAAAPLPMNMLKVSNIGMGIRYCIIFRPVLEAINPGASYVVEITGVKDASGTDIKIEYLVAFFQLNQ